MSNRHACALLAPRLCVHRHLQQLLLLPAPQSWSSLADKVKAVLRDFPELKLTEGRKVLEIRPSIMWDKGKAVEFLLKSLGKLASIHAAAVFVVLFVTACARE